MCACVCCVCVQSPPDSMCWEHCKCMGNGCQCVTAINGPLVLSSALHWHTHLSSLPAFLTHTHTHTHTHTRTHLKAEDLHFHVHRLNYHQHQHTAAPALEGVTLRTGKLEVPMQRVNISNLQIKCSHPPVWLVNYCKWYNYCCIWKSFTSKRGFNIDSYRMKIRLKQTKLRLCSDLTTHLGSRLVLMVQNNKNVY